MNSFDKLKTKLAELFQLDQADLDFGIYRIMNARRDEITRFLERDLLPQVREAFGEYKSSDKAEIQEELDKVAHGVKAAGMDPEQAPKVKELRARLAGEAVDITALENEVYDHLYSFFSRYYDEGDFISLRRYKEGVYAIPYEGEEVKLHWANHDQYYIKTTEYFRDYAFKTPSGHRVHFKIAEADTEKDNTKAANGNDRRFLLHGDKPVIEENGELIIRFEYRPDAEKRKQDAINVDTARRVMADLDDEKLAAWKDRLAVMWKRAGGKESDLSADKAGKTILDKNLFDYTRRNTFDYFIHKDLEGFLRRELDFYIKNEVMRLDDIEEESAPRVEQYLSKIKVIRRIAHKIIDFLAQIENFQKKLWLKKKFVVETNYCVTLDRVPEELYPEIAANDAQREEWVRLFAIDEIKGDLHAPAYSEPLTVEFLKANDKLVLDTKFFEDGFKMRLIASIDDIDGQCDGLLIHSENFQALESMQNRYSEQINCIYIDPPYNAKSSEIVYKNTFKHSSFLSFLHNRILSSKSLMSEEALINVAIDDYEHRGTLLLMDNIFSNDSFIANVVIQHNPRGRNDDNFYGTSHEYMIVYAININKATLGFFDLNDKDRAVYRQKDSISAYHEVSFMRTGNNSDRHTRPNLFYPIYVNVQEHEFSLEEKEGFLEVLPINKAGEEKTWRWEKKTFLSRCKTEISVKEKEGIIRLFKRRRLKGAGKKPKTIWYDSKYDASSNGIMYLRNILGKENEFSYPKSINTVQDTLYISMSNNGFVCDFFAGSGTTAHAVINLNREDGGNRKYILVEMGDHFDAVLKPRIKKVVYSKDWKDGKPVSREGISHMFKYIRLESYEDALANIELQRSKPQQLLIDKAGDFRESYMLKYMLDVESKGSQTLLNLDNFDDPWNYKLLVGVGSVGETKPVNVDLVETFNWLLGLKVKHIDKISGFQVVEGENPSGEKVLVIWRKVRDLDETDIEKIATAREHANRDLEAFFTKQQYNTLDSEFDVIYVNGDNNLMNVPLDPDKEGVEPRYKVRLIEEEFKRLMFDVKEI